MIRVKLTRKGKAAAGHIQTIWDELESNMTAGFYPKDSKRLRKLLLRAAANLATTLGGTEQNFDTPLDALDGHRIARRVAVLPTLAVGVRSNDASAG